MDGCRVCMQICMDDSIMQRGFCCFSWKELKKVKIKTDLQPVSRDFGITSIRVALRGSTQTKSRCTRPIIATAKAPAQLLDTDD